MDNTRIKEIIQLSMNIETGIPTGKSPDSDKVRLLFQQLRALSSVCMTGLDLRQDLKDKVPISELGKLYDSVRYIYDNSGLFSSDMAPKLRECLNSIVTILEGTLRLGSPNPASLDNKNMKTKVFISYAREDCDIAKRLYTDLKNMGYDVWIDIERLIPGENWKSAISKQIKDCSYFIALLSSQSVSKKGYVQKELKTALDILDEFPPSEIFLIPARIDQCAPLDERLQDIHFADLFPSYDEGLRKILQAISPQENCSPINSSSLPIKLKDIPNKDEEVIIFGKGVEHGYSEKEERQTYFVFSSNSSELTVNWYYKQEISQGNTSWHSFSKEPSYNSQNKQYRSPGWKTGNPRYKIKAIIKYSQMEKGLFWDSD